MQFTGKRAVSPDNELVAPADLLVNVGSRYRFEMGKLPATLRLQLSNVFDEYSWIVFGSGGLKRTPPRRFDATLSVDF